MLKHFSLPLLATAVVILSSYISFSRNRQPSTKNLQPGCYYQQVQCIRAPCPPILVCPSLTPSPSWNIYSNPNIPFTFNYPNELLLSEGNTIVLNQRQPLVSYVSFSLPGRLSNVNEFKSLVQSEADNSTPIVTLVHSVEFPYPALGFTENAGSDSWENIITRPNSNETLYVKIKYRTGYAYIAKQIISSFKFANKISPTPTCTPRPKCLDAIPRCLMPETSDMCGALPKPTAKEGPPETFIYECPPSGWVDCMPGPGPAKPQCQPDYLAWIQSNCPDFQGAAY